MGGSLGLPWYAAVGGSDKPLATGENVVPSEAANEATRRAWRARGFFCDRNHATKEWRVIGSVTGLRKFTSELRAYASNPANDRPAEYTHFGPAMNLEVGTWHQAEITEQWIGGPLVELRRLATLIERSAQGIAL